MSGELFDLTDRVAVVAGGAGYLGSAICRGLVQQGARVIVADIDVARAERRAEELNGIGRGQRSRAAQLDISREDSIRQLVDRVQADVKRLDILVNATTAPQEKSLEEIMGNDFTKSLGTNISGSFLLAREAKRAMTASGSIVMFSSMYGRVSPDPRIYHPPMRPNAIEYGAAKAAIDQMIRYLAVAWAPDGIRVNGIAPGPFPFPELQESDPDFAKRLAQKVPLGRVGRAEEIVGAVVFLASDAASYVTGHTLVVDGGWTIW
jgi:NAD(P)-dependent dehydrogenase (short-subunit alcohol dehydrogenase family)